MRSMTGYGSGLAALGEGQVVVDMRAVNHRFLDVHVHLPSRAHGQMPTVERIVRSRLQRGRVDVTARFEGQTLPEPMLDIDRARVVFRELAALRDELSPKESLPLTVLSSVPDLFVVRREIDDEALGQALEQAAQAACESLIAMRDKEGEALGSELGDRLSELRSIIRSLEVAVPEMVEGRRARLRDRLNAMLAGIDLELQPSRLEQEIALLADRSDITEELVRLESHRTQMLELIANSGLPVGKRIDFLLQEMAREANTIGSKVQDRAVTPQVVALKACIEQMREQAQNVL